MFSTISPISVLFASVTPFWLVSGQLMIPCENYEKHVYPKIILHKIKWNAINKCGNRFIFFFLPPFWKSTTESSADWLRLLDEIGSGCLGLC